MSAGGVLRGAGLAAALAGAACGGASREGAPEPTEWSSLRVREQWPEFEFGEPGAPACLTVWVISGDGCAVSDDGATPLECASAPDPFVLNALPDRFGTCVLDVEECASARCVDELPR